MNLNFEKKIGKLKKKQKRSTLFASIVNSLTIYLLDKIFLQNINSDIINFYSQFSTEDEDTRTVNKLKYKVLIQNVFIRKFLVVSRLAIV